MNTLPWKERINMISINPDAATRDDVARLASDVQQFVMMVHDIRSLLPTCDCDSCNKINATMAVIFKD